MTERWVVTVRGFGEARGLNTETRKFLEDRLKFHGNKGVAASIEVVKFNEMHVIEDGGNG